MLFNVYQLTRSQRQEEKNRKSTNLKSSNQTLTSFFGTFFNRLIIVRIN
jgi:hypothetical protein